MACHFEENICFDLGNLAAYDITSIETNDILNVSVANAKKLLEKITALPKEEDEEGEFFVLPEVVVKVPRAKPPPEEKPLTKWEKFRVSKGLGRRKKRSRLIYEPSVEGYVPRFGGYSIKKLKQKQNAIVEEKHGENPLVRQSVEKSLKKQEQKKRELANRMVSEAKKDKKTVKDSLENAKTSTAKLDHLPKKRVHKDHKSVKDEKTFNLELLDQVTKRKKNS
jgi:regulator of ribosome biosynthesis